MSYDSGKGSLFKNNDKTAPEHADYRGECNIGGQPHWINAWIRTSKAGAKYMALSIKPKEADTPQRRAVISPQSEEDPF